MIYGVRHHRRPMLPSVDEMSGGQYGPLGAGRPPATTFHQQQQPRQIRVTTEVRCLGPGKLLIETSPASRAGRRGSAPRYSGGRVAAASLSSRPGCAVHQTRLHVLLSRPLVLSSPAAAAALASVDQSTFASYSSSSHILFSSIPARRESRGRSGRPRRDDAHYFDDDDGDGDGGNGAESAHGPRHASSSSSSSSSSNAAAAAADSFPLCDDSTDKFSKSRKSTGDQNRLIELRRLFHLLDVSRGEGNIFS